MKSFNIACVLRGTISETSGTFLEHDESRYSYPKQRDAFKCASPALCPCLVTAVPLFRICARGPCRGPLAVGPGMHCFTKRPPSVAGWPVCPLAFGMYLHRILVFIDHER